MKYLVTFSWPTACLWHNGWYTLEEAEFFCKLFEMKMEVNYLDKTITIS